MYAWSDSIFQGWHEEDGVGRVEEDGGGYKAYRYSDDAYIFCGTYNSLDAARAACES